MVGVSQTDRAREAALQAETGKNENRKLVKIKTETGKSENYGANYLQFFIKYKGWSGILNGI